MRLGFGEVSRETVRRQIKENPDAFVIERHGSDLTAKWHVTCPKYGFSMRFDHLAANADMTGAARTNAEMNVKHTENIRRRNL